MLRQDQYESQNTLVIRNELEGQSLHIIRTQKTTPYRGKDWPTECIRWLGLHRFRFGDVDIIADQSMIFDAGPKLGVTVVYTPAPEVPYTPEERAESREYIRRAVEDIFKRECRWIDTPTAPVGAT